MFIHNDGSKSSWLSIFVKVKLKSAIVFLASHEQIPTKFAEQLIQQLGLKHL